MLSAFATHILALGILAGILLGIVLWGVTVYRRFVLTPAQAALYLLNVVLTRLLWRVSVNGRLPELPGQGAVVVCNHRAGIDPCFLEVATRQVVHWMVAKEYWSYPVLGWLFRTTEAIPVSRAGIDTAATKAAIRYVGQGKLVGMFPEGRINETDRILLPGRPGAALVALKARAPVIPCYIHGSPYGGTIWSSFFMRAKVRVEIGQPIDLSEYFGREKDREVLELVTKRLLIEIARLGGAQDYQPELAGRFYKPDAAE